MIKYVAHKHINKSKWDEAVAASLNSYIYALSWYLDIVTGNSWDALIKDDYEMVMPLPFSEKLGIKYIHQPVFTQQLGIFYKSTCSNFDIIEFLRAIPPKFRLIEQNFNKFLYGRLPRQYVVKQNINYELEITGDYSKIYSAYSTNNKRNIKKAGKNNLKFVNYVKPETLVDLFKQNKGKQIKAFDEDDYRKLIRLAYMLMHKGKAIIAGATNEQNTVLGGVLLVRSKGRLILLFTGLSPEGKEKGAMPFIIDTLIKMQGEANIIFDFEGSNDAGLARFFAGFGATAFKYERLEINRLNPLLKNAKKLYSKLR